MAVTGGSLLKMQIQHPTVGTAVLYGVQGEDNTYMLGGKQNEDNGIVDGAGRLLISKSLKPGYVQGTFSNDMSAALPEFEFMQRIANSTEEAKITITNINGTDYGGKGTVVGEVTLNGKAATFSLKMVSGLGFEKL
jgi:hypothetical protein